MKLINKTHKFLLVAVLFLATLSAASLVTVYASTSPPQPTEVDETTILMLDGHFIISQG